MNRTQRYHHGGEHGAVYSPISTPIVGHHASTPLDFGRYSDAEQSEHSSFLSLQTIRYKMEHKIGGVFKNRSLLVDLLAIFFGIGTWIGVNGTFIQLPLLVKEAPEGWSLPSYLSIMIQIGNLGPLLYTTVQKYSKRKLKDSYAIYAVLAIGTIACLLTAFFYNRTAVMWGREHSVALFVLTILTAINACTSSVLFMPYMGRFKEQYLITYFIGEGLSGLLPSVVALIQGIGSWGDCVLVNVTADGAEIYERNTTPPRFGTQTFFLILFGLMVCSYIGYTLLNSLKLAKDEYARMSVENGNKYKYESEDGKPDEATAADSQAEAISGAKYCYLLVLISAISFFSNGIFGSIQSYSTLPYGNQAYHYSATLSVIANPVACFLAMFLSFTSLRVINILSLLAALLTAFVFTTAVLSPFPPLYDTTLGAVLVITSWTLLIGVVSYTKLGITAVMRAQGGRSLVWVGGLTQLGSTIGAILIFVFINYTNCFQSAESKC